MKKVLLGLFLVLGASSQAAPDYHKSVGHVFFKHGKQIQKKDVTLYIPKTEGQGKIYAEVDGKKIDAAWGEKRDVSGQTRASLLFRDIPGAKGKEVLLKGTVLRGENLGLYYGDMYIRDGVTMVTTADDDGDGSAGPGCVCTEDCECETCECTDGNRCSEGCTCEPGDGTNPPTPPTQEVSDSSCCQGDSCKADSCKGGCKGDSCKGCKGDSCKAGDCCKGGCANGGCKGHCKGGCKGGCKGDKHTGPVASPVPWTYAGGFSFKCVAETN